MTVYAGVFCSVTSCDFNLGERGVSCGWLTGPGHRCRSAVYREAWEAAHELEQAQAADEPVQVSFLADVDSALTPTTHGLYESVMEVNR